MRGSASCLYSLFHKKRIVKNRIGISINERGKRVENFLIVQMLLKHQEN